MRSSFFKFFVLIGTVVLTASCDKDYNEIGSSIVDDDHIGFNVHTSDVIAYDKMYGDVQTSRSSASTNLPINALGYYNNPIFGKVTASFATQVLLKNQNPTIDLSLNPLVESVELNIPYFSSMTATDDDGNHLYELDSIQGSGKIKLSVYESGYFLRDFDPTTGFQQVQRYYSDMDAQIDAAKIGTRLNNSSETKQNDEFYFDPAEIVTYKTNDAGLQVIDQRRRPEMRLKLRNDFFQQKLFSSAASGKLVSNNVFKEYFRGLYFKVEPAASSPNQGSLAKINFRDGSITVKYTIEKSEDDDTRVEKELVINLGGGATIGNNISVGMFQNEYSANYLNAFNSTDQTVGDDQLWLKGGAGSMAVLNLFNGGDGNGNGIPDELDEMRDNKWLINDASITFYLDDVAMNPDTERPAYRIFLYDLKNKRPLIDYDYDVTTISGAPHLNKYVHGGIYLVDPAKRKYVVRLTNHIRNLVNTEIDSTNVPLGLVVTETINGLSTGTGKNTKNDAMRLKTPVSLTASSTLDEVPTSTMISQRGVILHGSGAGVPEAKKIKLKIYYTKKED